MLVYSIVYPSTHWIVYLICGLYISRKKSRCFFVIFSCKCPFYCSLQAVSTEGDIDLTNHCCFKSTFAGPNIQSSVSFQGKCSYKRGRGWICNEFHVLQQTVVCLKEKKKEKKNWVLRRSSHDKQYKWVSYTETEVQSRRCTVISSAKQSYHWRLEKKTTEYWLPERHLVDLCSNWLQIILIKVENRKVCNPPTSGFHLIVCACIPVFNPTCMTFDLLSTLWK